MLALCRASDRGYRRGLGVARLGGARCWLRPGDRCRASVRRSVAAHHNDRRWSDRIMRAGRKKDAAHHQYAKRPEASWSTFRHWTLVDRAPRRGSRTESYGARAALVGSSFTGRAWRALARSSGPRRASINGRIDAPPSHCSRSPAGRIPVVQCRRRTPRATPTVPALMTPPRSSASEPEATIGAPAAPSIPELVDTFPRAPPPKTEASSISPISKRPPLRRSALRHLHPYRD
jgi:hypothetical protein